MRFARRFGVALLVSVTLGAPTASQESAPAAGVAPAVAEVLALERQIEAALVHGDVPFLERAWADDFQFTHGDSWTSGGQPLAVNSKAAEIAAIVPGYFIARTLSSQHVEWHGDVAVTTGQINVQSRDGEPSHRQYSVWYLRVYGRRTGQWQLLSHRTVRGPVFKE